MRNETLSIGLDYRLNYKFYEKNTSNDETSFKDVQEVAFNSSINAYRDNVFIDIFDKYKRVPIDEREPVATDNVLVNMTNSNRFLVEPYLVVPLRLSTIRARYSYENLWYEVDEGDNTENHFGGLIVSRDFTGRLSVEASYSYLAHRPEQTESYDLQTATLSMEYEAFRHVNVFFGGGQAWFDFEQRENHSTSVWDAGVYLAKNIYAEDDFFADSSLYVLRCPEAQGKIAPCAGLFMGVGYEKQFDFSVTSGTFERDVIKANLAYEGRLKASLEIFGSIEEYISIDREDRAAGTVWFLSAPLSKRVSGEISGNYTYYEFLPEGEDVNRYSTRLILEYALTAVSLRMSYVYNDNNSSNDDNDYQNNVVWVEIELRG
jgi:hypothetical protein